MKAGCIWRIGDGRSVRIWGEAWLPDTGDPYIHMEAPMELNEAKVCSLMKVDENGWDDDCIKHLFNNRDARLVMNIPLSSRNVPDEHVWAWEEKGTFTVKSTYRHISGSGPEAQDKVWANVWHLQIPPKVKCFFWQLCNFCLPTTNMLEVKGVQCDRICPLCESMLETTLHLFVGCPVSKECWRLAGRGVEDLSGTSLEEWVQDVFSKLDVEACSLVAVMCWGIWRGRNDKVWKGVQVCSLELVNSALSFLHSWRAAYLEPQDMFRNHTVSEVRWTKLAARRVKLNSDAAINKESGCMGLGWVLRDADGLFVAARAVPVRGTYLLKEAEALSVREALSWLKAMEIDNVDVEMDAQQVYHAIHGDHLNSSFGSIVGDIKEAATLFGSVSFQFVNRSANRVTYAIAREAVSLSDCEDWHVNPPLIVYELLSLDLMNQSFLSKKK